MRMHIHWKFSFQLLKRDKIRAASPRPGVTQAPSAFTIVKFGTLAMTCADMSPNPLMTPLSRKRSPRITWVPLSFPVKITQFRMSVAFVPDSYLSEPSREKKSAVGPGVAFSAAHRERMFALECSKMGVWRLRSVPAKNVGDNWRKFVKEKSNVARIAMAVASTTVNEIVGEPANGRKTVADGWRGRQPPKERSLLDMVVRWMKPDHWCAAKRFLRSERRRCTSLVARCK